MALKAPNTCYLNKVIFDCLEDFSLQEGDQQKLRPPGDSLYRG